MGKMNKRTDQSVNKITEIITQEFFMESLLTAIHNILPFQDRSYQVPHRIDIAQLTIDKTNKQFERAFIEATRHGKAKRRYGL